MHQLNTKLICISLGNLYKTKRHRSPKANGLHEILRSGWKFAYELMKSFAALTSHTEKSNAHTHLCTLWILRRLLDFYYCFLNRHCPSNRHQNYFNRRLFTGKSRKKMARNTHISKETQFSLTSTKFYSGYQVCSWDMRVEEETTFA